MPSEAFEPAIPAIQRLQTYALDRTATYFLPLRDKYLPHTLFSNKFLRAIGGNF
jgi:hypothetical protein